MATSVTNFSNTIDINFPRYGESIVSVGEFQSNFKKISESFSVLSKDINTHINESFQTNASNDFGGNVIKSAVLQNHSYRANDLGIIDNGVVNLNYREGAYHKCTVNSGYYTFNVTNWNQRNTLSKIRLEIYNQTTATTSTCFIGFSGKIRYFGTLTSQVNLSSDSSIFYDIWTTDSGENIFVKPLGTNSTESLTYYIPPGGGGGGGGSPPTITSLAPSLWGVTGGEYATINGTDFIAGTVVKINNIAITTATASSTAISFYTPAGTAGFAVSVSVTTANGTTSTNAYYYDNTGGGGPE